LADRFEETAFDVSLKREGFIAIIHGLDFVYGN